MRGLRYWMSALRLARLAREHRIDVIHTHLTRATYLGALVGRLTRLPVVSSVHVLTHDVAYRYFFPRQRNQIITVSDFVRNALIRQGIPASRVQTIYNGTELCLPDAEGIAGPAAWADLAPSGREDEWLHASLPKETAGPLRSGGSADILPVRAEFSLPPEATLVGLFGHLDDQKGQPLLVQAAREIVACCPQTYFLFVGQARPSFQKRLWEMAARDGVADRLRFTGIRHDVPRLMASMDVVTAPSQREAFGMVIIEAMALEKPVVATRVGGIPELVADQETGLLVDSSPHALAEAISALLRAPDRRAAMGRSGRERVHARFSAKTMVDNIEALYYSIVGSQVCPGA